jgi:hypothetical protein
MTPMPPMPIPSVADRGMKASFIARRLAAIRYAHRPGWPGSADRARGGAHRDARHPPHHRNREGPKASATNDRLLAMVASQKMESPRTRWVVESQAREGADIASTRNGECSLAGLAGLCSACRSPTSQTRTAGFKSCRRRISHVNHLFARRKVNDRDRNRLGGRDCMVGKPETVLNTFIPCCKEAITDIVMHCRVLEICHDFWRDL